MELCSLLKSRIIYFIYLFIIYLFILLFRATPMAHGSCQARDQIRATAAGLHHTTATRDLRCLSDPHYSSQQRQIPNPLRKARDRICILMDTSWSCFRCAITGTPRIMYFKITNYDWSMEKIRKHFFLSIHIANVNRFTKIKKKKKNSKGRYDSS